jgi:methylthioribose-1-phosphate isomerase
VRSTQRAPVTETKALHTVEPIQWTSAGVVILDQLKLPSEVVHHTYTDYREVAKAIKTMIIRGAPAIGVAAAMGIAVGVQHSKAKTLEELRAEFPIICETLAHTRPTAVDLFWAIARFKRRFEEFALPWCRKLCWYTKSAAQAIAASENLAPRSCPNPAA